MLFVVIATQAILGHAQDRKVLPPTAPELAFRFVPTETSLKPDDFIGDVTLLIDGKEVGSLKGVKSAGQYSAVTGYGTERQHTGDSFV